MSKNIVKDTNNQPIKQMKTVEELNKMLPSERITFALEALVEMEQAEGWKPNMSTYHDYNRDTCFACLGGAAAIKALIPAGFSQPIKAEERYGFTLLLEISEDERDFVSTFESSIDSARQGIIKTMFRECGIESKIDYEFDRQITDYGDDRDIFFEEMIQLANDLKEAGY